MKELLTQIALEAHKANKYEDFVFTDVATEGTVKGVAFDVAHKAHSLGTAVKGWFEGLSKKKRHTNEVLEDTINWLKDEDRSNPKLNLDMGSFKTWLKTSEAYAYRYYYLLNDKVYNDIVSGLKQNNTSELEKVFEHIMNQAQVEQTYMSPDMQDRRSATSLLDNIKTIKDLIVIVDKYKARVNVIYDLLEKQERTIKGFPFQLMLRGAGDLRSTVKKIVNLST